ncbi:Holliday junction resolvase RuvX [Alicyclobacillus curvatus]|jgi:putative holliday junction resolvase|nr:Holliday junction resolvase RuvX [Alicyclobacillus curvatus]
MGRILAIDYGTVRIGLALSDPSGFLAQSLDVLKRRSDDDAIMRIAEIAREREASEMVVGLPLNMNGSEGEKADICRAFAAKLEERTGLPVHLFDERLTTVAAQRTLIEQDVRRSKRKQVVDAVAATVLLQTYLDFRNRDSRKQ